MHFCSAAAEHCRKNSMACKLDKILKTTKLTVMVGEKDDKNKKEKCQWAEAGKERQLKSVGFSDALCSGDE